MASEGKLVRLIGSKGFIAGQTIVLAAFILVNIYVPSLQFDSYPFIFLNLLLSILAAYTAPLIMVSQNRMADHDRALAEQDRKNTKMILDKISRLEKRLINKIEEEIGDD